MAVLHGGGGIGLRSTAAGPGEPGRHAGSSGGQYVTRKVEGKDGIIARRGRRRNENLAKKMPARSPDDAFGRFLGKRTAFARSGRPAARSARARERASRKGAKAQRK